MFKWFSKKTKDPGEGYISKAQYKEDIAYAYNLGKDAAYEEFNNELNLHTVEAMLDLDEHPGFSEDNAIERGKEFVIRELGKEVYKYAQHFLTSDNKYIAQLTVSSPYDGDSYAREYEANFDNV